MIIYLVDDEPLVLNDELDVIRSCCKNDEVTGFPTAKELLAAVKKKPCDIAFLDINLPDIKGTDLAITLKKMHPKINIIFVTAYDQYYRNAMEVHASGYLLKPIMKKDVEKELRDLRYEVGEENRYIFQVSCLGNFDVKTMDGQQVHFERSKAKEAFAYLVHLRGHPCTVRELAAALFEDEPFDHKCQMYMQKILSSLMKSLREYDAEDLVDKNFNSLSVKTEFLDCDYYKYLEEHKDAEYSIPEEYMDQYEWALY